MTSVPRWVTVCWFVAVASLLGGAVAASSDDRPSSKRIELRVETVANREGGPTEPCEVVQVESANTSPSFASWSTLGNCGAGVYPGSLAAPSLVHEIAA